MNKFLRSKPWNMTGENTPTLEDALASLPGRITLAFFTVIVMVGVLSLVLSYSISESNFLNSLLLLTMLGLSSGFSSRILLRKYSLAIRLLTAFVSLLIGIFIHNSLTTVLLGFQLENLGQALAKWVLILQFIYCVSVAVLSILAWHKPIDLFERRFVNPELRNVKTGSRVRSARTQSTWIKKIRWQMTRFRRISTKRWKGISSSSLLRMVKGIPPQINHLDRRIKSWINNRPFRSPRQIKLNSSFPRVSPSRKKLRLSKQPDSIKLVGEEVHNCPYCLEPVSKNDSRGLKICPICKTWHHVDCWKAAGECQVPHQH